MEKISLLFLRRELTRVRSRLLAGESFLITDRGKVIAALQPIQIGISTEGTPEEHARARELAEEHAPAVVVNPQKIAQQERDALLRGARSGKPAEG